MSSMRHKNVTFFGNGKAFSFESAAHGDAGWKGKGDWRAHFKVLCISIAEAIKVRKLLATRSNNMNSGILIAFKRARVEMF